MRVEMIEDEFEKYFARASTSPDSNQLSREEERRRGSLPNATLKTPDLLTTGTAGSGIRRTSSCKYPSRRRRERSSSPRTPKSPRGSISPRRTSTVSPETLADNSYVHEATLRAPSPGLDIKCHSAPHSRSSSWKKSKRPRGRQSDPTADNRVRTGSISLDDTINKLERLRLLQADDYCPVRNFSTTSKGLINRGDSFKRKSTTSVVSECGSGSTEERRSRINSQASTSSTNEPVFKVLVLGDHGVGKTALMQQFMTSEYMGAVDTSFDDEGSITVSVLLDGEETTMDFIDLPLQEVCEERLSEVDAFVLIFSLTDKSTFQHVTQMLQTIRGKDDRRTAIIVVGNKSEVIRSRQVTTEDAKETCVNFDAKYIEVSAVLNHRVDDLLVGIVSQIRFNPKRTTDHRRKMSGDKGKENSTCSSKSAKVIFDRIFRRQSLIAKSCDNLLVL